MTIAAGTLMWMPVPDQVGASRLHAFEQWLAKRDGVDFEDYEALWQWSVDDVGRFWRAVWDYFDILADGEPEPSLADSAMPGARWFPHVRLSYAEHVFRQASDARPALICRRENATATTVSWDALARDVGALAAWLRARGVGAGARIAAYLPSRPESVVAFLASASLGAVWTSCSPDMGPAMVIDRLRQVEPTILLATDAYFYAGREHDRRETVAELLKALPSVTTVVHVPSGSNAKVPGWRDSARWADAVAVAAPLVFDRLPFDHPLWIVYSSGTTGLPKAMVHSHGGIVLTHLKTLALQHDVRPGDRMMFLGSPGWIVWNLLVGGLLAGASVVLFDGHPAFPRRDSGWRVAAEQRVTLMGCGAAFLMQSMKEGLWPGADLDFSALRSINSTGSPLPPEAYQWVYDKVKRDLWLASVSGGTDIASGFVACAPSLPVRAGEIQCRELGVAAYAFDESGRPLVDEVGELVITKPMPSMPVFFWNDGGGARYRESYFETYPGVWRHGDWIRFLPYGGAVIYGRSDTTINRHGIRMGTGEIYRAVEDLPEVHDSLVVDLEYLGRPSFMPLFVVLAQGAVLDDGLRARIVDRIRRLVSPRHVPDAIVEVPEVPRTLTGKKMELPVRKLLLGAAPDAVASADAMANPDSLDFYVRYAKTRTLTA